MQNSEHHKVVYLMRGLPGCGKSHRAKRLAGESGIVLETDAYFYTQIGTDPESYDFDAALLPAARQWILERMRDALMAGISPVVVDRGNGMNPETREFAILAVAHGYSIELAEPDSLWWQELRVLLKYREFIDERLFTAWARKLSESTRQGHRVPANIILGWMKHWRYDLTVKMILECRD